MNEEAKNAMEALGVNAAGGEGDHAGGEIDWKAKYEEAQRQLASARVEEGRVKRFAKGHSRHFLYQLVSCTHCADHLHLRCTVCGKMYHMEDSESEEILREILTRHHFAVDEADAVLPGRCEACMNEKEPKK